MPNVTPHPGAGVLSIESYEASGKETKRPVSSNAAGQVVEARESDCCGQRAGRGGMGRIGKAEGWGLKDGDWRPEGLKDCGRRSLAEVGGRLQAAAYGWESGIAQEKQ
jgi:hypothetical protein